MCIVATAHAKINGYWLRVTEHVPDLIISVCCVITVERGCTVSDGGVVLFWLNSYYMYFMIKIEIIVTAFY